MRLFTGKRIADGVAAIHAMWGVGALVSFPAVIFWPGIQAFVFWPFVAMLSSWFVWKDCPLTKLEHWIRSKWDLESRGHVGDDGFMAHYVGRLIGVRIPRVIAERINYGYTVAILLIIVLL